MGDEVQKLGVQNLKPICIFAAALGNVGDEIGRETGMQRWGHLVELFGEVRTIGAVDFKAALAEFKDLDAAEQAEIVEAIKGKLNLVDKNLEAVIEEGLGIVGDLFSVVERSIALSKKLKG